MNKKYAIYQLRSLLTLFILIFSTLLLVGIIEALVARTYRMVDGSYYLENNDNALWMIAFSVAAFLLVSGLPTYGLRYQYKRQINDTYLQFPFKPKMLRIQSLLIPFLVFIIEMTVAFWFAIGLYYLRIAGFVEDETAVRVNPNALGYLLTYLWLLVSVTAQYLVACFWHSQSSSSRVGSLSVTLFTITCIFLLPGLVALVNRGDYFFSHTSLMAGPANYVVVWIIYLRPLTDRGTVLGPEGTHMAEMIVGITLTFLFAIGSAIYLWLAPERKGELAGSKTPSAWYEKLPALLGLTALAVLTKGMMFTVSVPLILLDITFAYFVYSLYDYHLKISLSSGVMLGVQGFIYILATILGAAM